MMNWVWTLSIFREFIAYWWCKDIYEYYEGENMQLHWGSQCYGRSGKGHHLSSGRWDGSKKVLVESSQLQWGSGKPGSGLDIAGVTVVKKRQTVHVFIKIRGVGSRFFSIKLKKGWWISWSLEIPFPVALKRRGGVNTGALPKNRQETCTPRAHHIAYDSRSLGVCVWTHTWGV